MPARVVVIAPNWLGDAVMALPSVAAIRRHDGTAALVVAARASIVPLFRMVAGVDEVVTLDAGRGRSGLAAWAAETRALAAAKADVAILLPNSFRSAWTARRAGIPERWGFATDWRRPLLTRVVARPRGRLHQSEYYRTLTQNQIGLDFSVCHPSGSPLEGLVQVPPEASGRAATLLARHGVDAAALLVGMAPGAAYGRAKQWPPDRYARLARLLHARFGAVPVLVGSRGDREAGEAIERAWSAADGSPAARLANLIGETDIPLVAGVMSRCRAFVSNDSGAMHLAAAVGLPVTAIFGSTDERETAPLAPASPAAPPHEILTCRVWCRPCMLRECPIDHRCMTGIDPERAAEAVGRQIEGNRRPCDDSRDHASDRLAT